ncbi:MAG: efflux RND transporter permease subunit [Bdellovibrionota bacterium]
MTKLIELSLERPVFAWILFSAFIIFGAMSLNKLGVSQMPDVDFPIVNVSVRYEGAAPSVVESDIIDPVEERLLAIEGIKEMRSSVSQGSGSVRIEFLINKNIDVAMQEVQSALSQLRLPEEADPPVIRKTNPEEEPIIYIGFSGSEPLQDVVKWAESNLLDRLQFIPQVGEVSIQGFSARNIRIWPDPAKLRKADLTVTEVADALVAQHLESAAGQLTIDNREYRLRWLGEANTVEDIKNIRILRRGGSIIQEVKYTIGDVATVEDGLSDIRRLSRIMGKDALTISVRKQRGANEVVVAAAIKKEIDKISSELPPGYKIQVNTDFTEPTKAVVHTTYEKLAIAAVITILVCWLFLGSWQSALNILFSLPVSIIGTFIVLYFAKFTLNIFTLLALTLAISIVVDDAIMILENIIRHYRMGKSPYQASLDGSKEILPAATAATFAVVAVFLPVIFMEGITGKFFFQLGVTLSAAVLLSLIEAVTITPMRTAMFLKSSPKSSKFELKLESLFHQWGELYGRIMAKCLRHSGLVVTISLVIFVASLLLVGKVKKEFVPSQDQNFIIASGQTPPGSSLAVTSERVAQLEKLLADDPNIQSFFVSIGGGPGGSSVTSFFMPIRLKPKEDRKLGHLEIMDSWRAKVKDLKGLRVSFRDISARNLTTGSLQPVAFNIIGPDLDTLSSKGQEMIKVLQDNGSARDLDTNFKMGFPELLILPNREAMAEFGVSVDVVAKALSIAVAGLPQTQYTADGKRIDVRVKIPEDKIKGVKDLESIYVRNQYGNMIQLSRLVIAKENKTYQSITRIDRQRSVGISGALGVGKTQGQVTEEVEKAAAQVLPDGYRINLEGASASLTESFRSLTVALLIGILVAYMILAIQFNSFLHPVTVLMALPFSITGALAILWISGSSLNLFSFIGLIVLMGIAKKNSIMLVEYTNQIRHRESAHAEDKDFLDKALIQAGSVRLRPILMTSVATIVAALPLVFGDGMGQETRTPMGLVIIGGSLVSTIMTLLVIPSLYKLLSRLENNKPEHFMNAGETAPVTANKNTGARPHASH